MDKQNVLYPNNEIFRHKKEWTADTCYNMDGLENIKLSKQKPDIKGHMLYACIYTKRPEQENP